MTNQLKNKPYCPLCNKCLDCFTALEEGSDAFPKPEDVTVCAYCGAILEYDLNLNLNFIKPDKLLEIDTATLWKAQQMRQNFLQMKTKRKGCVKNDLRN